MIGMINPRYVWLDFCRQLRLPINLFFTIALPAVMYVVFGVVQSYATEPTLHGNVSSLQMATMALYGAVTATTSLAGTASLEQHHGWRRQLSLTPYTAGQFVAGKVVMASMVAALPIAVVLLTGALTNAHLDAWWRWPLIGVLCLLGSSVFALYGLAVSAWFRSEEAVGLASGLLVVFFFLGNAFLPLEGAMLAFGRFTPVYGLVGLVRYPVLEGVVSADVTDPVWMLVLNVVVWGIIFAAVTMLGRRRGTARQ